MNMLQTQEVRPLFVETSGFYVFKKDDYLRTNTRIGKRPYVVTLNKKEAIDIDEPEDFKFAQGMLKIDFNERKVGVESDKYFFDIANSNAPHKNIKHIGFDLDGVLIDSVPVMKIAWQSVCQVYGLNIDFEKYLRCVGMPFYDILSVLGVDECQFNEIKEVYDNVSLKNEDKILVYPGVVDSLIALQKEGLKLSVVTSKTIDRTKSILMRYFSGIDFDAIVTPESVRDKRGKPNPDQLLYAALMTGVDPYNSLYVGDMEVDRIASNRAGFNFIHAEWGYGDILSNNDIWFRSMTDLIDFLLN